MHGDCNTVTFSIGSLIEVKHNQNAAIYSRIYPHKDHWRSTHDFMDVLVPETLCIVLSVIQVFGKFSKNDDPALMIVTPTPNGNVCVGFVSGDDVSLVL